MKFVASLTALAAFAASVVAQTEGFDSIGLPEKNAKLPAGKPFEVTWKAPAKYQDGTVSLHLIGGKTQNTQQPIADLAAGIPNADGKYEWTVDASLGDDAIYGLVVKWEKDPSIFQYSMPFHIVKAGGGDDKPSNGGKKTKTISKAYGTKTIELSSCSTTSTTPTSTYTPVYTPPVDNTTTPIATSTKTTITKAPVPVPTDTGIATVPEPSKPATVPNDNAGVRFGASYAALVGAVALAFAL